MVDGAVFYCLESAETQDGCDQGQQVKGERHGLEAKQTASAENVRGDHRGEGESSEEELEKQALHPLR